MTRATSPAGEPSLARAQALSDEGSVVEAIEEMDRLLTLRAEAPLHLRKAKFLLQRRNYEEAALELDRAAALAPEDLAVSVARAELWVLTDRLERAQAEFDRALALAPGDESLRLARLRILIQRGQSGPAAEEIGALGRSGSPRTRLEARLCRGMLALKVREHRAAGEEFTALMKELPKEDSISMRARFYWAASRAVDPEFRRRQGMDANAVKPTRLYLCGLGIFPPYTASLEVVHALSLCDVIFNNVAGPEVRELLAEFCGDIRPASYQAWQDEPKWADAIFAEIDKGRTVGFITRGHPLVFGGLAVELVRRCNAQSLAHQTFGAVSSIDHLLAYTGKGLGDDFGGIQAIDRPALERSPTLNTTLPLLACFYEGMDTRAQVTAFRKSLERFYPAAHLCWMFGPKYDSPPAVVAVGELEKAYPKVHSSLMLYVPPLKGAPAKARRSRKKK
ncbi:MAG: SAM-dependent methyltransferase [Elusimicrobiota bacterium]|nr:SAM-dependent methyltransferase [Elusimicrobiota bacterium]